MPENGRLAQTQGIWPRHILVHVIQKFVQAWTMQRVATFCIPAACLQEYHFVIIEKL